VNVEFTDCFKSNENKMAAMKNDGVEEARSIIL
jgi:hypothetical protein